MKNQLLEIAETIAAKPEQTESQITKRRDRDYGDGSKARCRKIAL